MSLHREDSFEELPRFEKMRKHRRDLRARTGMRQRMCTRKRRYHSNEHAKHVVKRREGRGSGNLRTYYCWLCNGWHLTSQVDAQ